MSTFVVKGQIVHGGFAEIGIRQKSDERIEIGELLVVDEPDAYLILQVYDLQYASQIPQASRELMAGINLEGYGQDLELFESQLRNYIIASAKTLVYVKKEDEKLISIIPKILPMFFSQIRQVTHEDLKILEIPNNPVFLGQVRSGTKLLDTEVFLDGEKMIPHHILIAATTGRGKSNFMKVLLWHVITNSEGKFGLLVFDPHNEYYGTSSNKYGLKDNPKANNQLHFFSPKPIKGKSNSHSLLINTEKLTPENIASIIDTSDAQNRAMKWYSNEYQEKWLERLITDTGSPDKSIPDTTFDVLKQRFNTQLDISNDGNGHVVCENMVFTVGDAGKSTIHDIINYLEQGNVVIIDTSQLRDSIELLISNMISVNILKRYREYKFQDLLENKPPIGIVLEEAPRVLSSDVLSKGDNIYSTIAKEGRKFKVGLIAITQLTSVIPSTILANINTKIILGNENKPERTAIINSACQDLSTDDKTIATLDIGEAIISSNFTKFAVPVKFPLFDEYADKEIQHQKKQNTNRKATKIAYDQ